MLDFSGAIVLYSEEKIRDFYLLVTVYLLTVPAFLALQLIYKEIAAIVGCTGRTMIMGDYKTEFKAAVDGIIGQTKAGGLSSGGRALAVSALCEDYVADRLRDNEQREADGRRPISVKPDCRQLDRLADTMLHDSLSDSTSWKSRHEEYPFLSEYQLERRKYGTHGGNGREVSGAIIDFIDTDRGLHRPSDKSERLIKEQLKIDEATVSRNKERRRKYNDFIKEQPMITYNLYATDDGAMG